VIFSLCPLRCLEAKKERENLSTTRAKTVIDPNPEVGPNLLVEKGLTKVKVQNAATPKDPVAQKGLKVRGEVAAQAGIKVRAPTNHCVNSS
jgi:hypothetical protein